MKLYTVTGMTCAACQARVEKAVSSLPGVESCAVSLLTNSMGVEGQVDPATVIRAVEKAGYGATLKGTSPSTESPTADAETSSIRRRLLWSLGFVGLLMYMSMGHVMWNWPLPAFLAQSPVAIGLTQMLAAVTVMIINRKFFVKKGSD